MKTSTISRRNLIFDPEKNQVENIYISSLDPLKADSILAKLPQMNSSRDVGSIIYALKTLIPDIEQIEHYNFYTALAAVRDLGILVGSLKRHGIEPVKVVSLLEPTLLKLGQITDMVPRDTLLHYTVWNPEGKRQRRYTTHLDEIKMVESARIAIPRLERAIGDLILLQQISLDSPEFVIHCTHCAENLNGMLDAIVHVINYVSRKVFAEELRPYFDSIVVQDKEYLGPGAVEMPLFIFDHLLWSSQDEDGFYLKFKQGFLPYCLPTLRKAYLEFEHYPSVLTRTCQHLQNAPVFKDTIISSTNGLMKLLHILLKFRKSHIKVAHQAYVYTENCVREKGSGGYQVGTLDYLTMLTSNAMKQLSQAINQYKELSASGDGNGLQEQMKQIIPVL